MSIILASGLGSLASERVRTASRASVYLLPAGAALLIALGAVAVQHAVDWAMPASLPVRALTALVFTFPIAFLLGFFFPLGMRSLEGRSAAARSWMWGLNGALGVLGSLLAILISMSFGIRACLFAGAACYLALLLPAAALGIGRAQQRRAVRRGSPSLAVPRDEQGEGTRLPREWKSRSAHPRAGPCKSLNNLACS